MSLQCWLGLELVMCSVVNPSWEKKGKDQMSSQVSFRRLIKGTMDTVFKDRCSRCVKHCKLMTSFKNYAYIVAFKLLTLILSFSKNSG